MAAGDFVSCEILPEGDRAILTFVGLGVGGTYDDGFVGDNEVTGSPKLVFNVTSLGYDATGVATTRARTVYGTFRDRTLFGTNTVAGSYTAGTFVEGETVTQAVSGATGKVMIGGASGPLLYIHTIVGTPNNSGVWTGGTSGATFTPTAVPSTLGTATDPGPREFFDGTNTKVWVWLSDVIYQKDKAGGGNSGTDVNMVLLSGFYTKTGTPNNGAAATVTNNSTLAYYKVVANHNGVDYDRITGATYRARAYAYHRHALDGKPVACVVWTLTQGANTETATATELAIDSGLDDALPVLEYYADIPTTSLTQNAVCTLNFKAYPWIGDSSSILDTSTGTAAPTVLHGPVPLLCDKGGTYGQTIALVDAATGVDPGAADATKVYDSAVFNAGTAYKFATLGRAAASIAAYNNANRGGRNDVGGGIIYCNAGNYAWLGSSNAYGTTPSTFITIKPADGVARASVVINSASGNGDISDRIRLENVTITVATANTFTNVVAIDFYKCHFNTAGTGILNTSNSIYWVRECRVEQMAQGFRPASAISCAPKMIRGCDFSGFNRSMMGYNICGNVKNGATVPLAQLILMDFAGMAVPVPVNFQIAFNAFYGLDNASPALSLGSREPNTHGGAIVQNIFEMALQSAGNGILDIASSDGATTNTPVDNIIFWHNVAVGGRSFMGYNDATALTKWRRGWSQANNYWDRWANKDDSFSPGNAMRFGGRQVKVMVGGSGNVLAQNMFSLPGNFYADFAGLSSYQPDTASYEDMDFPMFVDRQSAIANGVNASTAGAGDGDYHTLDGSPLRNRGVVLVLPYDLDGNARTTSNNDAGAYASDVAPSITDHPDSAVKTVGQSVTFTVVASGIPNPTYQWRKNGVNIGGATSSSYTIPSVSESDEASYDVVVTNSEGSVTSNAASLTVNPSGGGGGGGGSCDVQSLLDSGKCLYGNPHLQAVNVALWCSAVEVIADS